jgi:hypothetical protein
MKTVAVRLHKLDTIPVFQKDGWKDRLRKQITDSIFPKTGQLFIFNPTEVVHVFM